MQIMKHLITTVGEPKTRGGGGLERWVDEEDSQITMPEKGRRKGREDMKGNRGKERKSHTMATSASQDGAPVSWLMRRSHRQQECEVSFPFLNPRWVITHLSRDIKVFHRYLPFNAPMSLHWYGQFQYYIYKCEPQLHSSGLELRYSTTSTRYSCTSNI